MGRLKGLPSFAVVFREDKPPEEGDRGGLRLLETHPPQFRHSRDASTLRHHQDSVRPLLIGPKMYPSLLPPPHSRLPAAHSFRFPRHDRRISFPLPDSHVDNSKDTQAASPLHLREFNDYVCKSWMHKRRVSGASG